MYDFSTTLINLYKKGTSLRISFKAYKTARFWNLSYLSDFKGARLKIAPNRSFQNTVRSENTPNQIYFLP
jgi:hypothetical protein